MSTDVVRIGTRSSPLALAQVNLVKRALVSAHPNQRFETITISTTGDRDRVTALANMGGVGVFTKAIEHALLESEIDLAVHSAKDLPSQMIDNLAIAAVPPRGPIEDVLVSRDAFTLDTLPRGAVVGTGSPRRAAQLKHRRPDVVIKGIRGNVETRLQKLSDGAYDALVMARAGFERLGLKPDHMVVLSTDEFVPAGGQGALVVQARANDRLVRELAGAIDDPVTRGNLEAEREVLRLLDAGCAAAVGVSARVETVERVLSAVVLDKAGCKRLHSERRVSVSDSPDGLARAVADELLARGAADLIADE